MSTASGKTLGLIVTITDLAATGATPAELQARTATLIKSGNNLEEQFMAVDHILNTASMACEQFGSVIWKAWAILTNDGIWKVNLPPVHGIHRMVQ